MSPSEAERIVLVVPCYNEEARLRPAVFLDSLKTKQTLHWLFIDDGSTDATASIIQSMVDQEPERVFLHKLPKNSGKGEAVRQGLRIAFERGATLTGYFDADLATPMSEIFRLLTIFSVEGRTVLFGARVDLLGRNINRKRWRFWLGRCFAVIASKMLRLKVYDTQCGAKLIRAFPGLKSSIEQPFQSVWLFDVELIHRLINIGKLTHHDFFEEPLLVWTDVAGSKVKAKAFFIAIIDLIKIKLRAS